ncbi:MAG: hypothetical protein EAZ35_10460 [Sphingobacteriia bacterium]|nr:MAG: hypothetical protein EAZ41_06810 [Sphingobacteriia bacterium]TAG29566.1 MAG: hypothetical protein EAZ35_10460 [Sphingobacteriia bacterium]
MRGSILFNILCLLLFLSADISGQKLRNSSRKIISNSVYLAAYGSNLTSNSLTDTAAFIVARKNQIHTLLQAALPVKLLLDRKDENTILAQQIAISDSFFTRYIFDRTTKKPLWNEIFGIFPARPGDIRKGITALPGSLMRVEMYNYALNLTTIGLVNIFTQKMVSVDHYPDTQPDIPSSLVELAINIAIHAPEVEKALGYKPSASMPIMSSTKTALNRTKCERSQHLCVAPTFVKGDRALWAIVDLTDNRLVGLRWTSTGKDADKMVVTERRLQNETVADCYCEKINSIDQKGWKIDYIITASDGLMIQNVTFKNHRILNNAKLVDWHVSYSGTDGFGYSDAVGCPIFSQAAVIATEPPKIAAIMEGDQEVGFMLEQQFFSERWPGPCNYSYAQRYFFYNDGRFRVSCASIGRGCGNNGIYRPVFRIAFAGNNQSLYEWNNSDWKLWQTEQWQLQTASTRYHPDGYQYRLKTGETAGFYIEPGKGQFNDGGRGDQAFFYITKNHLDKDEGEADLVTIGPCCNTDHRQGPEKFMEPIAESVVNTDLVLWYVPQMKNDDTPGSKYCWAETYYENGVYKIKTYPCFAGPMFIPIK